MVLVDAAATLDLDGDGEAPFPHAVEFIISALEAGPRPAQERQKLKRSEYRVRATLRLHSDDSESPPRLLYARNVSPKAIAILSPQPLALSHGGILRITTPQGGVTEISCTVLRCREVAPGWFEGALYFNREQRAFNADELRKLRPE